MAIALYSPKIKFTDANGNPLAGGKLYSYEAGTSTPLATYTDAGGGTPNANPVILDANGEANVWLADDTYKFVLQNSASVVQWTVDNYSIFNEGGIPAARIATDAVTTAKILDSNVTTAKIADSNVTRAKLASGARAKGSVTASKTSAYTATSSDDVIPCDATSAGFTVTLPAAASSTGMEVVIVKTDASTNLVTIDGNGSETIGGATTTALATRYESIKIVCDGSNWQIVSRAIPITRTSFTPTGTFIANTTYTGFWRRSGANMIVDVHLAFAGAPTSTSLVVNMPTGYTIQNGGFPSVLANGTPVGQGVYVDSGTANYPLDVRYASSSTVGVFMWGASGTWANSSALTETAPATIASGDSIHLTFSVPITNWNN